MALQRICIVSFYFFSLPSSSCHSGCSKKALTPGLAMSLGFHSTTFRAINKYSQRYTTGKTLHSHSRLVVVRGEDDGDQGENAEKESRREPGEHRSAAIPLLHRNDRARNRADDTDNEHEHPARRIHQGHGNNGFGVDERVR